MAVAEGVQFDPDDSDLAAFRWQQDKYGYAKRVFRSGGRSNDRTRLAHRVVMERVVGRCLSPTELVDHINHNKLDNRRINLRLADKRLNGQNRKGANRNSSTGVLGLQSLTNGWKFTFLHMGKMHCSQSRMFCHALKNHTERKKTIGYGV